MAIFVRDLLYQEVFSLQVSCDVSMQVLNTCESDNDLPFGVLASEVSLSEETVARRRFHGENQAARIETDLNAKIDRQSVEPAKAEIGGFLSENHQQTKPTKSGSRQVAECSVVILKKTPYAAKVFELVLVG